MAFRNDSHCIKHKKITPHINGKCYYCQQEEEKEEMNKWDAMTIEEKLRDLHLRLKQLEKGPPIF
jgi:hypothetical protein